MLRSRQRRLAALVFVLACAGWRGNGQPRPVAKPAAPANSFKRSFEIVFTQTPRGASGVAAPERSRLAVLKPDGSVARLAADFHSAADPDVSFDGKRILFAGQKNAGDRWQIYEVQADGSGVRPVASLPMDCRNPVYQSKMYTITVEQPWYQITFVGVDDGEPDLYSVRRDGTGLRRLTYNPLGSMDPVQMPDGRIVFAAGQGKDLFDPAPARTSLFGVNLDGTDYALLSGPEGPERKRMPAVTTGRLVVFVEPRSVEFLSGGALGSVSLRRNLHSYKRLTAPAAGVFHSPSPLPDGRLLAGRRAGTGTFALAIVDPAGGAATPLYGDPAWNNVQPKAIVARPEPDGRSSVVDDAEPNGKLYCLGLGINDLPKPELLGAAARRVRVLEAVSPALETRLLGETALEADGSFHLQIPANIPLQLQIVDEDGLAVRSCGWIWIKNKEQRGCIGCHEDGELTPENRFAAALGKPAVALTLPPEKRRSVEYARDVAPVMAAKCATAGCHGAMETGPFIRPGAARISPLVWWLFGRSTARPWDHAAAPATVPPMPPKGAPPLTPEERQTIVEWIDLGARGGTP